MEGTKIVRSALDEQMRELHELERKLTRMAGVETKTKVVEGQIIQSIHDRELWKVSYDSWEDYKKHNEMGMSRQTIHNRMDLAKFYGSSIDKLEPENIDVDCSRLYKTFAILKKIEPEQLDKAIAIWWEKCNDLATPAFQDELRKANGKKSQEDCKCMDAKEYIKTVCAECGKVREEEILD